MKAILGGSLFFSVILFNNYWDNNLEKVDGWIDTITRTPDRYLLGVNMSNVSQEYAKLDLSYTESKTLRQCRLKQGLASSKRRIIMQNKICKAMKVSEMRGDNFSAQYIRNSIRTYTMMSEK
ncbi:hypothetical protein GCM10007916_12780 [Psychromonas marina]|uniref:DUF3617 family protein n=1 Tax=Psychromonas marina TaxID=88364 RepID=A0ABQ6DZN2_9GAMM|nr:hypothetical protein [Psychromonas marina]GLS90211.1 hypothetical protein GCM10007916_12780 [Psychromonas marina]